ncbi:MAG: hypothetical protein CMK06_06735, partial [Ponticaulis sp.]|nr:hypothetical protein [Ponticaulis sp.]
WVVDPEEEPDTETNCGTDFQEIRLERDNNTLVYFSQWSGAEEEARSDVNVMHSVQGELLPTIILQYDGEMRLDDTGQLVQWALFMPDDDHYYWSRLDWPTGRRTAMRVRCPDTVMIG